MSDPSDPSGPPVPRRPVVVLGLGVLVLLLSAAPFLNVLGVVLAAFVIRSGIRSLRRGRVVAGLGIGIAVLGVVVSVVVTFNVGRALLLDLTLAGSPPDATGRAGQWVEIERGDDLEVRVDSVECVPQPVEADGDACTVELQVRNNGSDEVDLDGDTVAAVVDGADYESLDFEERNVVVPAGATRSVTGTTRVFGDVTGVAINPFNVRGGNTTVISAP